MKPVYTYATYLCYFTGYGHATQSARAKSRRTRLDRDRDCWGVIIAGLAVLGINTWLNMQTAGITPGYGFLSQTAGFDLSESLIPRQRF